MNNTVISLLHELTFIVNPIIGNYCLQHKLILTIRLAKFKRALKTGIFMTV